MSRWRWSGKSLQDAVDLVSDRTFAPSRFGVVSVDDYGTPGLSVWHWFDSPEELLAFVTDIEPQVFDAEPEGQEVEALRATAQHLLPLTDEGRKKLNEVASGLFQIAWWGRGDELANADNQFASDLRTAYRESFGRRRNRPSDAPVTEEERVGWEAFLKDHDPAS